MPPKPSVDNWIASERPNSGGGQRFNSLKAAPAIIHESSLSASPDDSLVIDHDSLKNNEMALDSLQCPKQPPPPPIPSVNFQQPDSLSDAAFVKGNGGFFDSMEEEVETGNAPTQGKKKLIIPYATDSYSSNKSLSTSQDDEDEDEEDEEDDDEDVDEVSSVVKDVPIELARPIPPPPQTAMSGMGRRPVSASPALVGGPVSGHRLLPNPPNNLRRMSSGSNPDLRHGLCPNLNGPFPAKRLPDQPTAVSPVVAVSPQQQSLMRMATERMKRKFLGGWN